MSNKKLKIQNNFISINKIISITENIIKKYTESNIFNSSITHRNIRHNKIMKKYDLINKSEDSIIVYNIKSKKLDSLYRDIEYFRIIIPYLQKYKNNIEKIIDEINFEIMKIFIEKNKKKEDKIKKLSKNNDKYQELYKNIEKCIKYIEKIQKYYIYIFFILDNNISEEKENNETVVEENLRTKYFNKYYNRV